MNLEGGKDGFLSAAITFAVDKVGKRGEKVQEPVKVCFEIVGEIFFDV